jgi:hypothetical protein
MVAPVPTNPAPARWKPRVLFEGDYLKVSGVPYDVSLDGQRLLVLKPSRQREAAPFLRLVLNWQAELARLVPGR